MSTLKRLLVIPHIQIQNANGHSSPYTIGFPAMTSWLGTMHALQRHLTKAGFNGIKLKSVGVIAHDFSLETERSAGDYVSSIIGMRLPLNKRGNCQAFIEEIRINLEVSLTIEYDSLDPDLKDSVLTELEHILYGKMKIASGDIMGFNKPYFTNVESAVDTKRELRKLMPGYTLLDKSNLLKNSTNSDCDVLDTMLDHLVLHHSCEGTPENFEWKCKRLSAGWLVPISIGFQGITPLGHAKNQRDNTIQHKFAESVVTLGEFKMLNRIENIDVMQWAYNKQDDLYLCKTIETEEDEDNLEAFF